MNGPYSLAQLKEITSAFFSVSNMDVNIKERISHAGLDYNNDYQR